MKSSMGLLVMGCLAGCAGPPPTAFGGACVDDAECETGICAPDPDRFCTRECSGDSCPTSFVCGSSGLCGRTCTDGRTQGSGASEEICVGGAFVACSTQDAASACSVCGCEPFGGGTAWRGRDARSGSRTVRPARWPSSARPALATTTRAHVGRRVRRARPVSSTRIARRRTAAPTGTLRPPACATRSSARTARGAATDTCTNCIAYSSSSSICGRRHCGPEAACPQLGGRTWSCEMSTDGTQRCAEQCDPSASGYLCLDLVQDCRASGFCG